MNIEPYVTRKPSIGSQVWSNHSRIDACALRSWLRSVSFSENHWLRANRALNVPRVAMNGGFASA